MRIQLNAKVISGVFIAFSLFSLFPAHADILLTAPPRESVARGEALYGPLAEALTVKFGQPVVYARANDWIEYTTKMKADAYDIVFDGPHFAAWRMKHLGHTPVAKLPGKLVFVVVRNKDDKTVVHMRDLISFPLCAQASPNLGTMAVLSYFNNPLIQPDLYEVANVQEVYSLFRAGKCKAAVMQDKFLNKLPPAEKTQLQVMFTSTGYPDQTVSVSKRVTEKQRSTLIEFVTRAAGVPETQEILKQFTKQAKHFDPVRVEEYTGLESLLEGVLWGW